MFVCKRTHFTLKTKIDKYIFFGQLDILSVCPAIMSDNTKSQRKTVAKCRYLNAAEQKRQ